MKLFRLFIIAIILLAIAAPINASVLTNEKVDTPFGAYVSCANDGAGEWATGVLRLHVVIKDHMDKAGGYHYGFHYQPMGGVLIGEDTDNIYHTNGVTREGGYIGLDSLPFTVSFINNVRLISPGMAPNLKIKTTRHITINELGEVATYFDKSSVICE